MPPTSNHGKFMCAKCDGLFYDNPFHRMHDGKYCDRCLQLWRAEQHRAISTLSIGNRFRLMFGQPLLNQ